MPTTSKVKVLVRVRPTASFNPNVFRFDEGANSVDLIRSLAERWAWFVVLFFATSGLAATGIPLDKKYR